LAGDGSPCSDIRSENWSLNRLDKRKIEAAEMRFLRPIHFGTKERSSDIRE